MSQFPEFPPPPGPPDGAQATPYASPVGPHIPINIHAQHHPEIAPWDHPPPNPAGDVAAVGPLLPPQILQQAFTPLLRELQGTSASLRTLNDTVKAFDHRLTSLERAVQNRNEPGEDADDEGEPDATQSGGTRRKRTRRTGSKVTIPEGVRRKLQKATRDTLFNGCAVDNMDGLREGLSEDELKTRMNEDPNLPWQPDFLAALDHEKNTFWRDKIIDETLKNAKGLEQVENGTIPKEYWTREYIHEILKVTWGSCRKAVKKSMDPALQARASESATKGNRVARRERLYGRRRDVAIGDGKHPRFRYVVNGELRDIPPVLLIEEVTSDVISDDEYNVKDIRPDVTLEQHKENRGHFQFEGVAPFFRHSMWNDIVKAMDDQMDNQRGQPLHARYYAPWDNRGQRYTDPAKVADIPAAKLYRCHLSKLWYDRLPEWKKSSVKPSPKGWEVDEERERVMAATQTQS